MMDTNILPNNNTTSTTTTTTSKTRSTTAERASCPCKRIRCNLSTNTAAEYGCLLSLVHRYTINRHTTFKKSSASPGSSTSSTTSIIEPLHLAAQHGHVAVTLYLLQQGFHPDVGTPTIMHNPLPRIVGDSLTNNQQNSNCHNCNTTRYATPLHRACYSGAVSCVKLLLDYGADVTAVDDSFGDGMTPLHKAVKGGRYLAVAVLVLYPFQEVASSSPNTNNSNIRTNRISSSSISSSMSDAIKKLNIMMNCKDASNRTPLQLAKELENKRILSSARETIKRGGDDEGQEDMMASLRRWDQVAGGPASYAKCIAILERCKFEPSSIQAVATVPTTITGLEAATKLKILSPAIHGQDIFQIQHDDLAHEVDTLYKMASKWEKEFRQAMHEFTQKLATTMCGNQDDAVCSIPKCKSNHQGQEQPNVTPNTNTTAASTDATITPITTAAAITATMTSNYIPPKPTILAGRPCDHCGTNSLALFRALHGQTQRLYCSKCFRLHKSKRIQPTSMA